MSENETQPQAAAETPEVQLSDAEMESVAGGETVVDKAIDGIVDTVERWIDILT
ncbi:MAG TPA: hypothetical protein VEX86_14610 [Longimicrobium sp.]|nr:hypothetical protein [Longimicrobium sp.]